MTEKIKEKTLPVNPREYVLEKSVEFTDKLLELMDESQGLSRPGRVADCARAYAKILEVVLVYTDS
jgi:hypothetical protein